MRKRIILISIITVAVVSVAGAIYFFKLINSPLPIDMSQNILEIKTGEGVRIIADRLFVKKMIRSHLAFLVIVKLRQRPLQAGIYRLSSPVSIKQVFEIISAGKTTHQKITIPEGFRVEQIAQVLARAKLVSFDDFTAKAAPFEGRLFPDTYYFAFNSTVDDIIAKMRGNFQNRTVGLNLSEEDLIIASIVEREAILDEERPLIAGVFKNRLKYKMKLEADPTVLYSRDTLALFKLSTAEKENYKFWQSLPLADYHNIDSPFNTYEIAALPPAPIANPGLASITAVQNYEKHNYFYFLQKDGKIYPSRTEEEHNRNRARILGAKIGS